MREIPIRGDTIRLGQLLKLAGIADSGAEAKALLAGTASTAADANPAADAPTDPDAPTAGPGPPVVNGEPESRRGRQLHPGDVVEVDGERLLVAAIGSSPSGAG